MANVLLRIIAAAMTTIILTRSCMHARPIAKKATDSWPIQLMCASPFVSPTAKMQSVSHQMSVNATIQTMKNPSLRMLHTFVVPSVHRPKTARMASVHWKAFAIALNNLDCRRKSKTTSYQTNHWPLKFQTTTNRFLIGRSIWTQSIKCLQYTSV